MTNEARLQRFLRRGGAAPAGTTPAGALLLDGGERGTISVPGELVRRLLKAGTIRASGGLLHLASREDAPRDAARDRSGRDLGLRRIEDPEGFAADVLVNHAESPLAALVRRKAKDGAPFLSRLEFEAGERLRADFTRGALMPRLGMNWSSALAPGKRRRASSGIADLTDAALGARTRVEDALAAVGPELSGVLLDICCFLKGLEQVETERGWPVRSAKIMLKTALGTLARHYHPAAGRSEGTKPILHWGSGDYKPEVL